MHGRQHLSTWNVSRVGQQEKTQSSSAFKRASILLTPRLHWHPLWFLRVYKISFNLLFPENTLFQAIFTFNTSIQCNRSGLKSWDSNLPRPEPEITSRSDPMTIAKKPHLVRLLKITPGVHERLHFIDLCCFPPWVHSSGVERGRELSNNKKLLSS